MKKRLFTLVMLLLVISIPLMGVDAKTTKKATKKTTTTTTTTTAPKVIHDPIKMYVFYGKTCRFCAKLHEFTDELQKDPNYNYMFELVDLEVWYDKDNNDLMTEVADEFKFKVDGVPFTVIGEQYFKGFAEDSSPEKIKKMITEEYNNSKYRDVVAEIQENGSKVNKNVVGYIILGITALIIVAIILGRNKSTYYEVENKESDSKTEQK